MCERERVPERQTKKRRIIIIGKPCKIDNEAKVEEEKGGGEEYDVADDHDNIIDVLCLNLTHRF